MQLVLKFAGQAIGKIVHYLLGHSTETFLQRQ